MSVTNTFFTPERAMERFFYIQGLTKDEFYTDGGMNVSLEWLLYCELKRCGYERIVFFSSEWKFYCYDEESFQLMEYGRPKKIEVEKTPKKKGLKKGRWEKQTVVKQAGSQPEASEKEDFPHSAHRHFRGPGFPYGLCDVRRRTIWVMCFPLPSPRWLCY